jgi:hypothetical protein
MPCWHFLIDTGACAVLSSCSSYFRFSNAATNVLVTNAGYLSLTLAKSTSMGIGDKVKEVAHKMGVGHTKDEEPRGSDFGSSYQNVGATYGSEGTSGIAAPVNPGYATTASDIAAGPPMGEAYTTTGAGAGYTTGDVRREERAYTGTDTTTYGTQGTTAGEGVVCGAEHFTKVEDRPVVKERVELVQEHRPVEKEFVVETRATGAEREIPGGEVEHLGTQERVVAAAQPRAPCE